jgi:EAL domain-containing protein (putative c-di-GMP-specific phosphodiesterase class I)
MSGEMSVTRLNRELRAVSRCLQTLGLTAIAEGVETEAQREFLERNGCQACQGYLFSPPVPLVDFAELPALAR